VPLRKPNKATKRKRLEAGDADEQGRVHPLWSGTLTFGLVSVPVNILPANQPRRAPLRMLGPEGAPLSRRYYSQKTERDLDPDETVRGYEISKDKYVVVTDEELEQLAPEKSRDIDLRRFVPKDSIPPVYFDRGYFLVPDANSEKAYRLLADTMEKEGLAGIATFVMRGKEYLVAIFAENGILRAETMRFADELRSPGEIGLPDKKKVSKAAVKKFEKLIASRSKKELTRSHLKDEQKEALLKLVKKKQSKRANIVEVEGEKEREPGKVIDLVEVLKRSLSGKAA
jgi:DNA end-binding protein Ku